MAMTLVFGTRKGLPQAGRFAADYFGITGRVWCASRVEVEDRDGGRGMRGLYTRYLAGELEPLYFDGHAANIEDLSDADGQRWHLDLARDGLVDSFSIKGYLGYYALGARVVVRWLEEPGRLGGQCIEVWTDLNEHEFPMVTNPNPRQETHADFPNWRPGT